MNTESFGSLPSSWQVEYAELPIAEPLADLRGEIESQLARPLSSLPLSDLCGRGARVVIACDEVPFWQTTRALIVTCALNELERAGVVVEDVTLLIAAGMDAEATSSSTSADEWRPSGYAARVSIVRHNPDDVREMDDLGIFEGVPLSVNYRAVEADLLIGVSVMRLDDDATDLGSLATIAVGCAGAATVHELQTTRFLDDRIDSSSTLGRGALFERVVRESARRTGLVFAIDALVNENDGAVAVKAGSPISVNDALRGRAAELREALAGSSSYDVVIAEAAEPADANLFDMSRTAINVALARNPVLMRGGSLILALQPLERHTLNGEMSSIDQRPEARRFYDALTDGDTAQFAIQRMQGRSLSSGEARAYLMANVMQRNIVIAAGTGSGDDALTQASHVVPSRHIQEAAELAENFAGKRPRALIVRDALRAIPVYAGPRFGRDGHDAMDDLLGDLLDDIAIELPHYS